LVGWSVGRLTDYPTTRPTDCIAMADCGRYLRCPMPYPSFGPPSPRTQPGEARGLLEEPRYAPLIGEGHRGKTVLVTGGATGLGRAICLEFGRIGCNVAFCFVGM